MDNEIRLAPDKILNVGITEEDAPAYVGLKLAPNGYGIAVPNGYEVTVVGDGIRATRAALAKARRQQILAAAAEHRDRWANCILSLTGEDGGDDDARREVEQILLDAMDVTEQTRLGTDISSAYSYLAGCRRR